MSLIILCPTVHTSKISNPAMSRIPKKEAPCLFVLSRALFTRARIQRKRRSNFALAKASMAKSAWKRKEETVSERRNPLRSETENGWFPLEKM